DAPARTRPRAPPPRDRRPDRHALGADREPVRRAFDVGPHVHAAVARLERRTDAKLAVGTVGMPLDLARAAHQLRAHVRISARNDFPAASGGVTPKNSATVAPMSANVRRSPSGRARTQPPSARIGTASRE